MPRGPCFIDGVVSSVDSHHVFPLEYGGLADGPQFNLCKNHHDEVHQLAEDCWKHRITVETIADPKIRKLVEGVLKQRQVFAETGVAPDARRRVVAGLTPEQQQDLRLVKAHHGFTNQEAVLIWLITREAAAIKSGRSTLQSSS